MQKRKGIIIFTLIFLFILSAFPMMVHADEYFTCTLCGGQHKVGEIQEIDGFAAFAYNVEVLANGTFENAGEILGDISGRYNLMSILEFDTSGAGEFGPLMAAISPYYDFTVIIGMLIIILYFFLDLMEVSLNEGFTYESLVKHCIKAFIGMLILRNGMTIIGYGIAICNYAFSVFVPGEEELLIPPIYNGVGECVYGKLIDPDAIFIKSNPIQAIATIFENFIPALAVIISYALVRVVVWVRVFDIAVRIIFAPIGMSDILHGGLQAPGFKYFQKLMASVLNGACIMGVMLCYQALRPALMGSLNATVASVAIGFAIIMLTRRTQQIAEEIVGV